MTHKPKLLLPDLILHIEAGDINLANHVVNILCHDLAWLAVTINICGHQECLEEKLEAITDLMHEYVDGMKDGPQRLNVERANEIVEAALARAIRRDK